MKNLEYVVPAFFDLEMINITADFGKLLCGVIKPYGHPPKIFRLDDYAGEGLHHDRLLAIALRDELEKGFNIVSWNGVYFDIRFIQSVLLHYGERGFRVPVHEDLMFTAKKNLVLSSNRLATVQGFLGLETDKLTYSRDHWNGAAVGIRADMDYVVERCVRDVNILEEAWDRLSPFITKMFRG